MIRGNCPHCGAPNSLYIVDEATGPEEHCVICGYVRYKGGRPLPFPDTGRSEVLFRQKREKVEAL